MSRKGPKRIIDSSETLKKEDIVQAIVVVDSFQREFLPITCDIPIALIPVVNTPLLDYTLECLALSSVQEVILFCSSHADVIKEHVKKSKWNGLASGMSVTVMVSETCRSLGDAMRDLDAKAVIRSDFILVSGEMVANLNLLPILEHHRKLQKQDKGAVMTMVYKEAGPGHFSRSIEDEVVLAVDASTGRVLVHHKLKNGDKKINIPLETYVDRSCVELRYDLQDTHVAICSPAVPPLFSDNFDFQTRDDFVRGLLMNEEILSSTIYWYRLDEAQYAACVSNWQMYQSVSHDIIYRWVYPFVPDSPFSWDTEPYMFLRHNIYKQKSVKLGKGCMLKEDIVIGEDTSVGENTHISHSVIGKNCHLGKNVTIYKSYIWDNVVIGDNCNISCAVVGHQSKLGAHVTVSKGCILGLGVVLPHGSNLEASILVARLIQSETVDQDEVYKVEKVGDQAYRLLVDQTEFDSEDEGQARCLHGLWLERNGGDGGSESDEEFSASSGVSGHVSPFPDDPYMFYSEVVDSLTRGYDDKLHPDNLILEINSSRYAYNVSVREVNYFVMKAMLSLPIQAQSVDSTPKYLAEFKKVLQDFFPILRNYVRNSDAQHDCLNALEGMAASTEILHGGLMKLLHLLYEKDILGEDVIMEWYENGDAESSIDVALRKQVYPFIRWLKEADEESDQSGSD